MEVEASMLSVLTPPWSPQYEQRWPPREEPDTDPALKKLTDQGTLQEVRK